MHNRTVNDAVAALSTQSNRNLRLSILEAVFSHSSKPSMNMISVASNFILGVISPKAVLKVVSSHMKFVAPARFLAFSRIGDTMRSRLGILATTVSKAKRNNL